MYDTANFFKNLFQYATIGSGTTLKKQATEKIACFHDYMLEYSSIRSWLKGFARSGQTSLMK